ncbi:MAG: hypothetical protein ABIS29_11855 [Vicinamibacterales bacterium]
MTNQATTQTEVVEVDSSGGGYEMETRLMAMKNVYAENNEQKREGVRSYSSYTTAVSLNNFKKIEVSPEERFHMIAKEAHQRAELHQFQATRLSQDWCDAEAEIDKMLKGNEPELPPPHPDERLRGHE